MNQALYAHMNNKRKMKKKIWSLLKKLDIDLPYDPAIPLLGIYQKTVTQFSPEAPAHPCLLQH
jgi:hypothetical protein